MSRPLCAGDLKEGLFVCQLGNPETPGRVLSWNEGSSPDTTTVEVGWLGEQPTVTSLSGLEDFRSLVTDVRTKSEAYRKLLAEMRRLDERDDRMPLPGERRDCLTCRHKASPICEEPCFSCRPVTGGAVNWIRRCETARAG
jgi:hypothetical protein